MISKSLVTHYGFADNYLLGLMGDNLIWLYVFDLRGDETQVQKVDIHPFITKPIEVTIPPMKYFLLVAFMHCQASVGC
jgi:hypothetical protein